MAGSRKFGVTAGALVVVAAAVWFGGNYYAKIRIEEQLNAYLVENGMQQNVTWRSLDASILGNASLHDVKVVHEDDPARFFTINNLTVHQLQVDNDEQHYDFEFAGVADETGNSPLLSLLADKAGELGYDKLPLLEGRMKGVQDEKQDAGDLDLVLKQPEVGELKAVVKVSQIAELIKASRTQRDELQSNPLALMGALSSLKIHQLSVMFDDGGVMPRVVKVQQGVAPVDGKPTEQQLQAFDARVAQEESNCLKEAPTQGIANAEQVCKSVSRFMKNDAGSLKISITPNPPLQLMSFVMQTQMGNREAIAKAVQQLNVKVSN
ncbi:hypothetical protein CAP48_14695 [Advenella sp. S44]|uniref:hypothetical protein n=1 Tax=Advenella sp. S44 TaxID=1982755 RepID=UPI000C2A160B|nr:hypothetical protein [Advenella sp. S44]PJX22185.1 hypothetical protein CAP48_14695 [Advenella sp. S44]